MADLLTAIQTLATKLIPNSTGAKRQAYIQRLSDYADRLAGVDPQPAAAVKAKLPEDWSGTFDQALARFLDGEDKLLEAAGKPFGRNGAERGALDRDTHIKLATDLGVLDELGGPDFFGPETPGASL